MLNGERPTECDYCWRVEDSGQSFLIELINHLNLGLNLTLIKLEKWDGDKISTQNM